MNGKWNPRLWLRKRLGASRLLPMKCATQPTRVPRGLGAEGSAERVSVLSLLADRHRLK